MKKKYLSQIIRHIIQFTSFVLFPGLFILALNSISGIYQSFIGGTFSFSTQGSAILTLFAVIPITILWGRFFCGYLCTFGSMQEFVAFVSKKLKMKQIRLSTKNDSLMKKAKYLVLILLFAAWTTKISLDTVNPWYVFGVYSSLSGWTSFSILFSIGGALLFLIIAASLFKERFFCRYLCPLGAIFSVISVPRIFNVRKKNSVCINCDYCSLNCPMGINVNIEGVHHERVMSSECIDCFRCTSSCPVDALKTTRNEAISGSLAALTIAGVYYAGMIPIAASDSSNIHTDNSTYVENYEEAEQGRFKDGIYSGSGQGFRGNTEVSVAVTGGKISSIIVESYMDDTEFFNRAKNTIISSIISNQSTDVTTVSGATFSSNSILEAVANALDIPFTNTNNQIQSGHRHEGI